MKQVMVAIAMSVAGGFAMADAQQAVPRSTDVSIVEVADRDSRAANPAITGEVCPEARAFIIADGDDGRIGYVSLADIDNGDGVRIETSLPAGGCLLGDGDGAANTPTLMF